MISFESLVAGRYPPDSLPQETIGRGRVETANSLLPPHPAMSLMPEPFQAFARDLGRELSEAVRQALSALRWRTGEISHSLATPDPWFRWDIGDGEWRALPGTILLTTAAHSYVELSSAAREDVIRLILGGVREPFAYELVREAWLQRFGNPRAALVTAITALEIAVKQFIARRVPSAEWLVENTPAPDVIRLLREYLPTLDPPHGAPPTARRFQRLPDKLVDRLRIRRDQRNNVIHKPAFYDPSRSDGPPPITPERAATAVLAVREILYRLDAADGHAWAENYLATWSKPGPANGYRGVR